MRALALAALALGALTAALATAASAPRPAAASRVDGARAVTGSERAGALLASAARVAHDPSRSPHEPAPVARAARTVAPARARAILEGRVGTRPAILVLCTGADRGRRIETDAAGAFRAEGLAPGPVIVAVESRELGPCERLVRLSNVRPTRLELVAGPARTIRGRVLDADGTPLGGARVAIDGHETFTAADGGFTHVQAVAGRPLARVEAGGHAPAAAELPDEGGRALEFALERAGTLEVLAATDLELELRSLERPRPVRGAVATLLPGSSPARLRAGERLLLEGLPPGRLRATVRAGDAQRSIDLRLAARATSRLDLAGG